MSKRSLATLALFFVLAIGLMPGLAFAADGGGLVAAQSNAIVEGEAPPKPLASQIKCEIRDVYEQYTVVYDGVPVGSQTGEYLGVGLAVKYEPRADEVAFMGGDGEYADNDYNFTARAVKKRETPANKPDTKFYYNDDVRDVYRGGTYITDPLEPDTTYYVYVATCTRGGTGRDYFNNDWYYVWSDWSDPITVKTPPAKEANKKANKKANPITAKAKAVTFNASKVKAKAQSVKASKAFTVKNAKGAVTYKATKDVTKGAMKKVTVAKGGKVTVKRGTKAGTYKLKVRIAAAGDSTYASGSKTVTLAVKVK